MTSEAQDEIFKADVEPIKVEKTNCCWCMKGLLFKKEKSTGNLAVFRCLCSMGGWAPRTYPVWSASMEKDYD